METFNPTTWALATAIALVVSAVVMGGVLLHARYEATRRDDSADSGRGAWVGQ